MKQLRNAPMTEKQRLFVAEYLIDFNGTKAAIRAGYSPRCARGLANRMLRHRPEIADAVRNALAARQARMFVNADRLLLEYTRLAFSDIRAVADWGPEGLTPKLPSALSDDEAAAIAEVSTSGGKNGGGVKLKLHDKKKALDAIARHLGLFTKRLDTDPDPRDDDALPAREILRRKLAALAGEGID